MVTLYLTSRFAPDVPYTVLMLIEGFLINYFSQLTNKTCPLNAMQDSIYLWASILDGDLILLVFLPALLFSDAMTLNVNQFRRAAGQCLLLAGPGVLFTAALMGIFTWKTSPYEWSESGVRLK